MSTTLPLRSELAMTFTTWSLRRMADVATVAAHARTAAGSRRSSWRLPQAIRASPAHRRARRPSRLQPLMTSARSSLALVARRTSTPTGARSCWRAAAIEAALRGWFEARASSRSRRRPCRSRPATRRICTPSRPSRRPGRRATRRSTCTPRRSSPARSCWRPASGGSSTSPGCSATASAGRCTIPSSPCWNGIAPSEPYEALMRDCAALLALAAETAGRDELRLPRRAPPIRSPSRSG